MTTVVSEGNIFFLLGFPRSGTSLLRLLLHTHPNISIAPECPMIPWLSKKYGSLNLNNLSLAELEDFVEDLFNVRKFETWKLEKNVLQEYILKRRPSDYASLILTIFRLYAQRSGKPKALLGDKNNYYMKCLPLLLHFFPLARFILITRDVRDVCASIQDINSRQFQSIYKPKFESNLILEAQNWNDQHLTLLDLVEDMQYFCHIRYEDLVLFPEVTVEKITNFLGLELDSKVFDFWKINKAYSLEPKETLEWKLRTLEPITTESVGRWTRDLNTSTHLKIIEITGNTMELLGY